VASPQDDVGGPQEGASSRGEGAPPRRVVIIGGGITGLAAAYRVLKDARSGRGGSSGRAPVVTLIEGSDRLGGNIRTERVDGLIIDGGPDAFVIAKPHATALCKELGLGDRLVGTVARNRKVYVLYEGRLHPLPEGMFLTVPTDLVSTARTKLLSWQGKARAALDLTMPKEIPPGDESIGQFVRRRLGREVAERIADPLLGGIYAGDLDALSIRATFPQLVALEEQHGSLIRGVLAQRAAKAAAAMTPGGRAEGGLAGGPLAGLFKKREAPPSAFHSLAGGMGELVDTLAARIDELGAEIRMRTQVEAILQPGLQPGPQPGPGSAPRGLSSEGAAPRFTVRVLLPTGVHESIPADDVLLAAPAYRAAEALRELDPELSSLLREVPYESTATVILAFPRSAVPHALDASGLIIPKLERRRILAVTFVSSKWEGRAPSGTALLRVFVGGHRDPRAIDQDDAGLIDLARSELRDILGVKGDPTLTRVYRYPRGSAQPILGHLARVAKVRARAALYPGLYLAGGAFDGVGIPDCVRQATEVAGRILGNAGQAKP
jgi:oxygen-dependent protoporphyrinogen oxidase